MHSGGQAVSRFFQKCLVGEILVILAVTAIFRSIESRIVAGALAGTCFVAIGLFIVRGGVRSSVIRKSPTFFMGIVHLMLSAFPLMVTRLLNQSVEFRDLAVMGIPGPVFHQLSTGLYMLLLLATVFDLVRFWRQERAKA